MGATCGTTLTPEMIVQIPALVPKLSPIKDRFCFFYIYMLSCNFYSAKFLNIEGTTNPLCANI